MQGWQDNVIERNPKPNGYTSVKYYPLVEPRKRKKTRKSTKVKITIEVDLMTLIRDNPDLKNLLRKAL